MYSFVFESYLRCASNDVFEALHLEDIEVAGQTDREDNLKLGEFFEAAEDNPYSGIR